MKILHTSDWHLGQSFYDIDRSADHAAMLECLRDAAVAERPDAIVVSGDIFDTAIPTIRAQRMLHDWLRQIKHDLPDATVVITAGNHDGVTRLEISRGVWSDLGVHLVGTPDAANQIIEVAGKGWIVAVPHIYEGNYPRLDDEDSSTDRDALVAARMEAYHNRLLGAVGQRNAAGLPVVMMAHAAVTGSDTTGHDTARFMFYPLGSMGRGYDYLALGHIHRPQTLASADRCARYSGSPLRLSFDEPEAKSFSIVEIDSHGTAPRVREIEVRAGLPLIDFPADGVPLGPEATLNALRHLPDDTEGYLRVRIDGSQPVAGNIRSEIIRTLQGKKVKYCTMQTVRPASTSDSGAPTLISRDELRVADPVDMASAAFSARYGTAMPQGLLDKLATAIRTADSREE